MTNKNQCGCPKLIASYFVTLSIVLLGVNLSGCHESSSETHAQIVPNNELLDPSVDDFHNLGWVGLRTYPLNKSFSFDDPEDEEQTVSPGGLAVAEVLASSPAMDAGFKKDDIIVGVEDDWVPIKDDPTIDVFEQLESRVTSAESESSIRVYRDGEIVSLSVKNPAKSLDDGLPDAVERYSAAALVGLNQLARQQNSDGSFGSDDLAVDSKLQITSLAGLAFLAANDSKFQQNIDDCKTYVANQLDLSVQSNQSSTEKPESIAAEEKQPKPAGAMMMQMPEFDIEPLTATYLAQFLAESKVSMMDPKWMPRLIGVVGVLSRSQHESGGWNVSDDADESTVDVAATFITNQALQAIGMLERIGVSGNPEVIKKACSYLKSQMSARAGSPVDRRVKAGLTAGTGAALVAINCQPSDPVLERAIEDGLELVSEMHAAPSLALPNMLATATLARQSGNETWLRFHENAKLILNMTASPDGQFVSIPNECDKALEFEQNILDPAWQSAHYCLLLSMQAGHLKTLTGQTMSPMAVARNSAGEASKGGPTRRPGLPPGLPGNGNVMSFTLDDLSGEGSMEDQIKEKLKEMGIDTSNIKMGTTGQVPGNAGSKDESKKKP